MHAREGRLKVSNDDFANDLVFTVRLFGAHAPPRMVSNGCKFGNIPSLKFPLNKYSHKIYLRECLELDSSLSLKSVNSDFLMFDPLFLIPDFWIPHSQLKSRKTESFFFKRSQLILLPNKKNKKNKNKKFHIAHFSFSLAYNDNPHIWIFHNISFFRCHYIISLIHSHYIHVK